MDIQAIVQALVNKFDYNDDEIFIQIQGTLDQSFYASTSYPTPDFRVYTHGDYTSRKGSKLSGVSPQFDQTQLTTATSQGTSIYSPKLVIDFTVAGPNQSDSLVDAMILAQGSVLGRCKQGGP